MKLVFGCQARSLDMFFGLTQAMRSQGMDVQPAFYVAESLHFGRFARRHPDVLNSPLLREWEIVAEALRHRPDPAVIARIDREYGDPTAWNTILCDRRLVYGPFSTLRQDYRRRFSDDQLLSILQHGYQQVEAFVDRVRPDAIVTFICVTFGEYMLHQVARRRGIPFLNLRPTRIGNFITYGRSVFEPAEPIREAYLARRAARPSDSWRTAAEEYLAFVRTKHARYEGVIVPGETEAISGSTAISRLLNVARTEWEYLTGPARRDNHVPNPLATLWFARVANPRRAARHARRLGAQYVPASELPNTRYALFPLHYEPEVSLLVYGRPYVNQIEVVRAAARALPAGMTLLVKEHPAALKNRKGGFYDALLRIANVRLLDPACASRDAVRHASLVITIAGSMGFEALVLGRPVVLLGHVPYELLPETMVRRATLADLPDAVAGLGQGGTFDETALVDYVAAVMERSVRANLYSDLLGRGGVSGAAVAGHGATDSMSELARYTAACVHRAQAGAVSGPIEAQGAGGR